MVDKPPSSCQRSTFGDFCKSVELGGAKDENLACRDDDEVGAAKCEGKPEQPVSLQPAPKGAESGMRHGSWKRVEVVPVVDRGGPLDQELVMR